MAGYSGTPLAQKFGIKPGSAVALLSAPAGFADTLEGLPAGVVLRTRASGSADVVVSFHTRGASSRPRIPALLKVLSVDGGLWISWPKKASKVPTDITEDVLREVFLPLGLVDNKVCAVDETWSGLRLVWRKELRAARRG